MADPVILLDVGRGGAGLIVADPPAIGEAVWFVVEPGPAGGATAVARISGVERMAEKMWRVSLAFDVRCPDDLLLAASSGHAAFVSGLN